MLGDDGNTKVLGRTIIQDTIFRTLLGEMTASALSRGSTKPQELGNKEKRGQSRLVLVK